MLSSISAARGAPVTPVRRRSLLGRQSLGKRDYGQDGIWENSIGRRARRPRHQSGQAVFLAGCKALQARRRSVLSLRRERSCRRHPRSTKPAEALRRWRREPAVLSEARAGESSGMAEDRYAVLSI